MQSSTFGESIAENRERVHLSPRQLVETGSVHTVVKIGCLDATDRHPAERNQNLELHLCVTFALVAALARSSRTTRLHRTRSFFEPASASEFRHPCFYWLGFHRRDDQWQVGHDIEPLQLGLLFLSSE